MADKNDERRSETREMPRYTAYLVYEDMTMSCVVENISSHGAYVSMGASEFCAEYTVGDMVTLTFPPETGIHESVNGRILRRVDGEDLCYVAVYFTGTVTFI